MLHTTTKNWILRFFKGVIIALGFILPGVSGGVLAAILGIYERMLKFMAHLTTNFKENFLFFLPVGIGGIVGIGLLSNPIEYLLSHYQLIVLWGFSGAIMGTLPSLLKESVVRKKRDKIDILWALFAAIGGFFFLYYLEDLFGVVPSNFGGFVLAGALIALGVLVPGLSPSNLLIVLGLFNPMLVGFKTFDIAGVFLPIALGGMLAMLLFAKLMDKLLETFHSRVYHFIIGLVLASTILIDLPPVADYSHVESMTLVLSGVFFILGLLLGLWMSRLEEKYK
jgi:putative membrane protein